jgi:hypothetical protein
MIWASHAWHSVPPDSRRCLESEAGPTVVERVLNWYACPHAERVIVWMVRATRGPVTSTQLFTRVAIYGIVLGAIDAVSGRTLQASPEPSVLLGLLATAWVAYRLSETRRANVALPAALAIWAVYFGSFAAVAHLLVGWNNSVPWQPRSVGWVIGFAVAATIVAVAAQLAGSRAARAATTTHR